MQPGVKEVFDASLQAHRSRRRRDRRSTAAARRLRALRLLRDRARRGQRQPGALRRRALRPARRRADGPDRHVRAHARRRLRSRGQAPHHARHVRALVRLLRRLLRPGPEGPHEDRRGLHARPSTSCDFIVTPTAPSVAFGIGEKVDDPLSMYLCDLLHGAGLAGRSAGDHVPAGLATSDGSAVAEPGTDGALPVGLQIVGAALQGERAAERRQTSSSGDRLRRRTLDLERS